MEECKDKLTYDQEEALALAILEEQEDRNEFQFKERMSVPASLLDIIF